MSTSPAIAPILFVSPFRNEHGKDPNRLLRAPERKTPDQVWAQARDNGVTVIIINTNEAAVRVGSPEYGMVGYTTVEHALAFSCAVLTRISDWMRKCDEEQARQDAASGRGR